MKPFQFIISILFFIILSSACTNNSTAKYVHELEQRSDGRYYKAGEDKPFTGIVTSEIMGGEWEYITGTEVRSTGYYPNGKKRHETIRGGEIQYFNPQGQPISREEYREKYTPTKLGY